MICKNYYLADILRLFEIKDLIWMMRFQSPLVYEENFIEKSTKMQGPFFKAPPVNLINKSSDMLFQKVQQIYTHLVNINTFRNFIIDQSGNTFQLKYCAEFPPTF